LGLPLSYNRRSKTFFYEKNCMLKVDISVRELGEYELNKFSGGTNYWKNLICAIGLHNQDIILLSNS